MILKSLAPVLVYEVADSLEKMGVKTRKELFNPGMDKKVRQERQNFLKKDILQSSLPPETKEKMGLNFEELFYDMNVVVKGNELLDMNYETYTEDISTDFAFWDSLYGIPNVMLNTILSCFGFEFTVEDVFSTLEETFAQILEIVNSKLTGKRYSYSVYKLFSRSRNLELQDKIFILYRYRLVTSLQYLEQIIPPLTVMKGDVLILDLKAFVRKYQATVVVIVGKELQSLDTEFGNNIICELEESVPDKRFYPLNRKLRNNIHYLSVEVLDEDEIKLVDLYQKVYFQQVIQHIREQLYIDIDDESIMMTNFLHECKEKGISKEELDQNYKKYYLNFYYYGSLE
jgi:hypothetical protein